jgi:hypothetical protein
MRHLRRPQAGSGKSVAAEWARGNDRQMEDERAPWRFEGMLVEHPSYGRGRLFAEPDGEWCRFVPSESGPILALPANRAASEVRVVPPEEMTEDELEDLDWASARWSPLVQLHPSLAAEMLGLIIDSFFAAGGLDPRWRTEAGNQLQIDLGHTQEGVRILRLLLPIAAGESLYEWDGDAADAKEIAIGAGEAAGRTISIEREAGSPCGWEPVDPDA